MVGLALRGTNIWDWAVLCAAIVPLSSRTDSGTKRIQTGLRGCLKSYFATRIW
jgi:hypothetical protein